MTDLPQPLSPPLPVPAPQDEPYVGPLKLHVDATDVLRRIFGICQTIPVAGGGVLTLLVPQWLPGYHSPQTMIELIAGFAFRADGRELHWSRHPTEVFALHVDVPAGVTQIEARFQFLSPTDPAQGRVVVSPDLLTLQWSHAVLYPAGHYARRIAYEPSLTLPAGWQFGTALPVERHEGDHITFATTMLDELVDSPVMAGRHHRAFDLDPAGDVALHVFADHPDQLAALPDQIEAHRAVVEQADKLFGARPFDRFRVLLTLSDEVGATGVEHHRSCEIASIPGYFTEWESSFPRHDSFPHEFIHAWNGKHLRGADSWTASFNQPIRNSLMWVYEGQTQYWDRVLSTRSGLWTAEHARGALADIAAKHDAQAGSRWRPLADTTKDPIIAARSPLPWPSWQRSEDYYTEGALIWLDVDTRIRELTGEARSLDDFARAFFAERDDADGFTEPYLFDDLIRTLVDIAAFDWSAFFIDKLQNTREDAPLAGIERAGYRLVYRAEPSAYWRAKHALMGETNLLHAIGLSASQDGRVGEVQWASAAFDAAITAGSQIVGVGNWSFSPAILERAVAAGEPVQLTVRSGQHQRVVELPCAGHRYPHLEPIAGAVPRLDHILTPR